MALNIKFIFHWYNNIIATNYYFLNLNFFCLFSGMIETPVAALSSTHYSTALGSLGQEGPIQQKNQVTYFQCFN